MKKRKYEVYSSMPQIRPGITYLTKKNENSEFHDTYNKKMSDLQQRKTQLEQRIEDLEDDFKKLEADESSANLLPADNKKLKRLIPIYREKRKNKEESKNMKEELIKVKQHIVKIEHMQKNLALREEIFENINMNPDKLKDYKERQGEKNNRYLDKKIDVQRLKKIKRGFYIDILEAANSQKTKFSRDERKYDLDKILENHKQYTHENKIRYEGAAHRHKAMLERQEKKYFKVKMLRNQGLYHEARPKLYPYDEDGMEDYDEMYEMMKSGHRGASAVSKSGFRGRINLY